MHNTCGVRTLGLVLAVLSGVASAQTGQEPESPKVHVVIVGVPNWTIADYKDGPLGSEIHDACGEIVSFFSRRFARDQIEFHPNATDPCTVENTTYAALRHLLYVELPRFGRGTLTFLFLMSHGEMDTYAGPFLGQDLRFIASDTREDDKESTSLSVGIELLNWLQKVPPGSTVLTFVDTCNSGSLETMKLELDEGLQHYLGLRFGLIVASLSDQSTYQANFTRSVLDLWSSQECPDSDIENRLYELIKSRTKIKELEGVDGLPNVLIPYGGSWCLTQLGSAQRLLFLYQGSERNVTWTIRDQDPGRTPQKTLRVVDSPFKLLVLPSGIYTVSARLHGGKVMTLGYADLRRASTVPKFLQNPATLRALGEALGSFAEFSKYRGVTAQERAELDGNVEIAALAERGTASRAEATAKSAAITPSAAEEIVRSVEEDPEDRGGLRGAALDLANKGDFHAASLVLSVGARSAEDQRTRDDLALLAYLYAAAAGEPKLAENVRRRFFSLGQQVLPIQVVAAEKTALKIRTPQTLDSFQVAGTRALTEYRR